MWKCPILLRECLWFLSSVFMLFILVPKAQCGTLLEGASFWILSEFLLFSPFSGVAVTILIHPAILQRHQCVSQLADTCSPGHILGEAQGAGRGTWMWSLVPSLGVDTYQDCLVTMEALRVQGLICSFSDSLITSRTYVFVWGLASCRLTGWRVRVRMTRGSAPPSPVHGPEIRLITKKWHLQGMKTTVCT